MRLEVIRVVLLVITKEVWVGDLVEDVRDEEEISWVREGGEGAVRGDYG